MSVRQRSEREEATLESIESKIDDLETKIETIRDFIDQLEDALVSVAQDTIRVGGDQNIPFSQTADGKLVLKVE